MLKCEYCLVKFSSMLMLPHSLWHQVSKGKTKIVLCANCIVSQLPLQSILFTHKLKTQESKDSNSVTVTTQEYTVGGHIDIKI